MMAFVSVLALGMTFFHPKDLHSASIRGNIEAVRLILTSGAPQSLDLDQALRISASLGRLDVTKLLVEHGATDMDGALMRAAAQNQMVVVRWLISSERAYPATDFSRALKIAGSTGAAEAEFLLLTMQRHY